MNDNHGFDEVIGSVILPTFASDLVTALRGLCKDIGVTGLTMSYRGSSEGAADTPEWCCEAVLSGETILIGERHSPSEAALAMAERLLRNAECAMCNRRVALMPGPHLPEPYCAWKLIGTEWTPGCQIEHLISMVTQPGRHVAPATPTDEQFSEILSEWSKEAGGDGT
jgi:hypothetical protein